MFQINPLNSSYSQKLQYPERTVLFQKSPLQTYLLYLMSNAQLLLWNCQINTFTMEEWDICKCFIVTSSVE